MRAHTVIGEHLCGELRTLRRVRPIIRHHHERLDGSGYPDGLRGEAIPITAQIVGLVDAYDAMTTSRPYRRALTDDSPGNGGGRLGKQVGEAFVQLQAGMGAFSRREIVLRDLDRGLIDFPAIRDGREVYLCWIDGEPDIGYWHELDAGYRGRRPL